MAGLSLFSVCFSINLKGLADKYGLTFASGLSSVFDTFALFNIAMILMDLILKIFDTRVGQKCTYLSYKLRGC